MIASLKRLVSASSNRCGMFVASLQTEASRRVEGSSDKECVWNCWRNLRAGLHQGGQQGRGRNLGGAAPLQTRVGSPSFTNILNIFEKKLPDCCSWLPNASFPASLCVPSSTSTWVSWPGSSLRPSSLSPSPPPASQTTLTGTCPPSLCTWRERWRLSSSAHWSSEAWTSKLKVWSVFPSLLQSDRFNKPAWITQNVN